MHCELKNDSASFLKSMFRMHCNFSVDSILCLCIFLCLVFDGAVCFTNSRTVNIPLEPKITINKVKKGLNDLQDFNLHLSCDIKANLHDSVERTSTFLHELLSVWLKDSLERHFLLKTKLRIDSIENSDAFRESKN